MHFLLPPFAADLGGLVPAEVPQGHQVLREWTAHKKRTARAAGGPASH